MDNLVAIIVACVGCTAFWQVIDHVLEARKKSKFNIEESVQQIQTNMDKIQSNMDKMQNNQNAMQKSIECLSDIVAENEVTNKKVRVLQSTDEVLRGIPQSKDRLDQILEDVDGIERYWESHPNDRSNQMVMNMNLIRRQYEYDLNHGTFLQYGTK